MFSSVALNVVIGLVFIYLLYSLLTTVISEMIATVLGIKARNLKEAVDRMLNDEKKEKDGILYRFWDSVKILKNPTNEVIDKFYNDPEIKYLGSSGVFTSPSNFKAVSFSKTLLSILFGSERVTKNKIDIGLKKTIEELGKEEKSKIKINDLHVDNETARYLLSLWEESEGDVSKFKAKLEGWFDRTMEQATEWYRRKIQVVLLILGFILACLFNADTFTIIKKLSVDKDARDKIVSMANTYLANNKDLPQINSNSGSSVTGSFNQKMDSLLSVKKTLEADLINANTILGTGVSLPDSVQVVINPKTKEKTYIPAIDPLGLSKDDKKIKSDYLTFTTGKRWGYFFRLVRHHFWGYIITAIAISLGAPFWFDLLNKLMKLRTAFKQEAVEGNQTIPTTQQVEVKINTKPAEEAVG